MCCLSCGLSVSGCPSVVVGSWSFVFDETSPWSCQSLSGLPVTTGQGTQPVCAALLFLWLGLGGLSLVQSLVVVTEGEVLSLDGKKVG